MFVSPKKNSCLISSRFFSLEFIESEISWPWYWVLVLRVQIVKCCGGEHHSFIILYDPLANFRRLYLPILRHIIIIIIIFFCFKGYCMFLSTINYVFYFKENCVEEVDLSIFMWMGKKISVQCPSHPTYFLDFRPVDICFSLTTLFYLSANFVDSQLASSSLVYSASIFWFSWDQFWPTLSDPMCRVLLQPSHLDLLYSSMHRNFKGFFFFRRWRTWMSRSISSYTLEFYRSFSAHDEIFFSIFTLKFFSSVFSFSFSFDSHVGPTYVHYRPQGAISSVTTWLQPNEWRYSQWYRSSTPSRTP